MSSPARPRSNPLRSRTALRTATALACGALATVALQLPGTSQADPVAPGDDAAERRAAMTEAVATGARVEIVSARTASSATYANPDGSLTFEASAIGDTWVQSGLPNTSQHTSPELRVGTSSVGLIKARSYLRFDTSALDVDPGWIVEADVELSNFVAGSCSGSPIRLSQVTSAWTVPAITWAKQPTTAVAGSTTTDTGRGAKGCTAEGDVAFDATAIVAAWADGQANHGVQLKADKESLNASWRKYRSSEGGAATKPTLTVVVNEPPATPADAALTPGGGDYTTSTTPAISAVLSDPEGAAVTGRFEIFDASRSSIWVGTSEAVPSGETASVDVPSGVLEEGGVYALVVHAQDPLGERSAEPLVKAFGVDSVAPALVISSAQLADGTWTTAIPAPATISLAGGPGTGGFYIDYDGSTATIAADADGNRDLVFTPTAGWHVLRVTPVDRAGNLGEQVTFQFGVGPAAFATPKMWDTSTGSFPIDLSSRPGATGAKLEWRIANQTVWRTATKLTDGEGAAWTGAVTDAPGRSVSGPLTWNATQEPLGTGTLKAPALVEIRGCFQYAEGAESCSASLYVGLVAPPPAG